MYSKSDLIKRLSAVHHFRNLPADDLEKIILSGQIHSFQSGETVFQEQSPSAGLFVLLSGQVQLCKQSPQGQNTILAVFDPIIMFNEVAALDGGPNPVTVVTTAETVVWRVSAANLEAIILRHPHLGFALLKVMAARNRYLVGKVEDLSFRSVQARAAKLLVELSVNGSQVIDRRKHPNHQLAARIATVPEAFSRSLKVFKICGHIVCSGSTITVLDAPGLKELAELTDRIA